MEWLNKQGVPKLAGSWVRLSLPAFAVAEAGARSSDGGRSRVNPTEAPDEDLSFLWSRCSRRRIPTAERSRVLKLREQQRFQFLSWKIPRNKGPSWDKRVGQRASVKKDAPIIQ